MTELRVSPQGVIAGRDPVRIASIAQWRVLSIPDGTNTHLYVFQALPDQAVAGWSPQHGKETAT